MERGNLDPQKHPRSYGIIGDGKMAQHTVAYFDFLQIPSVTWSRKLGSEAELTSKMKDCNTLLILLSDSAIEPWVEAHPNLWTKTLIHFSGSRRVPRVIGIHPLLSFGPTLYSKETYSKIPFIGDVNPSLFRDLFPGLPNPYYPLDPNKKALYHSLCVLGGNLSTLLWQKLFQDFESRLGIPREAALPFLEQVTYNLMHRPETALTGPLQRRDKGTMELNAAALKGDPYQTIYRAFAEAHGMPLSGDF